jgi:cutinase
VAKLPGIGQSITAISGALTSFETTIGAVLHVDETENGGACTAMAVIFARGTTEPGNVGLVTGPPFFKALEGMIGAKALSVQGVEYPASIEGFLQGGDAAGSQTM